MWRSWGDHFEIVSYDKEKRPRSFRNSHIFVIVLLVITFCVNTFSFSQILPQTAFGQFLPAAVTLFSAVVSIVLFLIKWMKNGKECDLSLIFATALFLLIYIVLT
jgi:hypothetical protein